MEVFTTKLESVLLIKPPTVFEDFRKGASADTVNCSLLCNGAFLDCHMNYANGCECDGSTHQCLGGTCQ